LRTASNSARFSGKRATSASSCLPATTLPESATRSSTGFTAGASASTNRSTTRPTAITIPARITAATTSPTSSGAHDVIVVKWDGFNPRFAGDNYKRPYNISPVETSRQFPLVFPRAGRFHRRQLPHHRRPRSSRHGGPVDGRIHVFLDRRQVPAPGVQRVEFHGVFGVLRGPARLPGGIPPRRDVRQLRGRAHAPGDRRARFHPVLPPPDERHLEIRARLARDRGFRLRSRHARHGQDAGVSHECLRAPAPRPAVWNHADVYPNFTSLGLGGGLGPQAAGLHRALECLGRGVPLVGARVAAGRRHDSGRETLHRNRQAVSAAQAANRYHRPAARRQRAAADDRPPGPTGR
jgi:hypothetical protein